MLPICVDGYVKHENYFNADVLLIKPSFIRDNFENLLKACEFIYEKGYDCFEQDALNYLFSENYLHLPRNFNEGLITFFPANKLDFRYVNRENRAIYHFSSQKPLLDTDNPYNKLYFEYFLKTPWANAEMFGNIDKALKKQLRQTVNGSKDNLLHMTNLLARRQRAFFVEKHNIDAIKQIFAVKNDELIINATQPNADKILFDEMNKSSGEKIFFIFTSNYWQIAKILVEQNFVEGVDFINAIMFLSERYGFMMNFDTREIAKEL